MRSFTFFSLFALSLPLLSACGDKDDTATDTDTEEDADADADSDADADADADTDTDADADSDADSDVALLVPEDGVATDITLEVYSNGWGNHLGTLSMKTEGEITIDIEESEPYGSDPTYEVYAFADGFYTELFGANKGVPVTVDLDQVPQIAGAFGGAIFGQQYYFIDHYLAEHPIVVEASDGTLYETTTDAQGRYGYSGFPAGPVEIRFNYEEVNFTFAVETGAKGTHYEDYFFDDPAQAAKPNLYLYPETETHVDVTLGFPMGGAVIDSDPPYGDGWSVNVTPEGIIDDTWSYLYYEASVPSVFDADVGWLLEGASLESELRALLAEQGLVGREIEDFVEFWVPEWEDAAYLAIYPQVAETSVTLDIEPAPASLLRLLWMVRELPTPITMTEPPPAEPFLREGFTAVEWGVLRL